MSLRLSLFATVLLSLVVSAEASAQGFNTYSGRNHPELDWQVAETAHFRIAYPAHLAGIEAEAAAIAEESYSALSANLGVTFPQKIRIYLSDEDEITNGFAVPVGYGHTNIWVHVNDAATLWTGPEKWLRKVIAHELAHIFHFKATRTRLGLLAYALADPMPRFWTEGLAQYLTEDWDAFRGDIWIRTATLEGRLNYRDAASIWNPRLLYAVGNSQARFFADQYGDSSLAALLQHRRPALFGLARVHDFNPAMRATIGKSYREFYDAWRRHVNIYYATMAGQMENLDSLEARRIRPPGQYYADIRYSPDTNRVAVLAVTSLDEPVRRLYVVDKEDGLRTRRVAEGSIHPPVSWSPDGTHIAYAQRTRGRYGSLLNDLYVVPADGGRPLRLTHSRRASSPVFSPEGDQLLFIGSEHGTGNLFLLDLRMRTEQQLTFFEGDVQLGTVQWQPGGNLAAFSRFAEDGVRDLLILDVETRFIDTLSGGAFDDRLPIWSRDGRHLAFTSLRDDVPNAFVIENVVEQGARIEQRVTAVATGATITDWLPPDTAYTAGRFVITATESKRRDAALLFDAARRTEEPGPEVSDEFAAWTAHRPPHEIATEIPPDPDLVQRRYAYNSWRNITHVVSLALPYYFGRNDWGVAGMTTWMEPLGKHTISFLGAASFASPADDSWFAASYVNNQLRPTLALSAYRFPGAARFYGDALLVESLTGAELAMRWPLDLFDRPFVSTTLGSRLRYAHSEPLNPEDFDLLPAGLLPPEAGTQADVQLGFTYRRMRPYRHNAIHPLSGAGFRAQTTAAARVLGSETRFIRPDLAIFAVLPGLADQRFFVYGRGQIQFGRSLAQDYVGFSRYDDVSLPLADAVPLRFGDSERVRGYRQVAIGNRMLFGTVEYRVPFLTDLQTRILGLIAFGRTTLATFADAGMVWTNADIEHADRRLGVGVELKNVLRLGALNILHAVGAAQPASELGGDRIDWYYRIRTTIPF